MGWYDGHYCIHFLDENNEPDSKKAKEFLEYAKVKENWKEKSSLPQFFGRW